MIITKSIKLFLAYTVASTTFLPKDAFILACSSKISSFVMASSLATFSLWISSIALSKWTLSFADPVNPSPDITDDFENCAVTFEAVSTPDFFLSSLDVTKFFICSSGTPNKSFPNVANCWANKLFLVSAVFALNVDSFCWYDNNCDYNNYYFNDSFQSFYWNLIV